MWQVCGAELTALLQVLIAVPVCLRDLLDMFHSLRSAKLPPRPLQRLFLWQMAVVSWFMWFHVAQLETDDTRVSSSMKEPGIKGQELHLAPRAESNKATEFKALGSSCC